MADTKISNLTSYTTPLDADVLPIVDTANTATKKVSWSNVKATLRTYFDTLYQPLDSDLTTIAGLTATTNNFIVSVSSAWASRTPAQVKTTLSLDNVDNTSDSTKNSATATITNKRNQPRIVSAASYTTDTGTSLDVSTTDIFVITAQAGSLLFNAPGGTPVQGEKLIIRIKDNGTARALTWNSVFRAMGTALPSTTVLSKTLYLGFFYNSTDTKWDLVASAQEA